MGDVAAGLQADWQARFAPLIARAKAERAARVAAFRAAGGQCLDCWDTGPCAYCARGQAAMAAAEAQAIAELVERAGLPQRFRDCTFASFPGKPAVRDALALFVSTWDGRQNLILLGRYGVGKSGLLASALNFLAPHFHQERLTLRFTATPALFDRLRAGYEDGSFDASMRACQSAGLLLLDDLGAEKPTAWVLERLYAIVNHRYERELPTWVSSNLTPDAIADALGERVWYRLKEGARVLEVTGPNLRERSQHDPR